MPITKNEQRIYEEKIQLLNQMEVGEWAATSFSDKQFRLILIKTMYNLIQDSIKPKMEFSDEVLLDDQRFAKYALEEILLDMMKIATDKHKGKVFKFRPNKLSKEVKGYSTGQLANYFSVSTTTINNWINEGRFLYECDGQFNTISRKTTNEKLKIHPDTWFDAPSGVRYQVKDVVTAFEEDVMEWNKPKQNSFVSEEEQIYSYLNHFKDKYMGQDFQTVFGEKDWDNLTDEEETDAAMWYFFLKRIKRDKDPRD